MTLQRVKEWLPIQGSEVEKMKIEEFVDREAWNNKYHERKGSTVNSERESWLGLPFLLKTPKKTRGL